MTGRLIVGLLAASSTVVMIGCGPSGPRVYEVTGTATLDGTPIPEGDIVFLPEEKAFGPDAGKIVDGKYRAEVKGGKKTVQIRAARLVPGKKGPMGEDVIEDYIPARYNDRTELHIEVGEGETEHPFTLKSK